MKKFIVAAVTGFAVSDQLLSDTAAAQIAQTKNGATPPALNTAEFDK